MHAGFKYNNFDDFPIQNCARLEYTRNFFLFLFSFIILFEKFRQ